MPAEPRLELRDAPGAGGSITLVGVNHRTAPITLRERLALADESLDAALAAAGRMTTETCILSTCNRTEVYAVTDQADASTALLGLLIEVSGVPASSLAGHTYSRSGESCVRHLLRVACGLDSMVLGEAQILGQVRDAFDVARGAGVVGPVLGRVLSLALEVGRRARVETRIGRGAVSSSSVAVELAKRALGQLRDRSVLVVGAGDAAQATVRSLADAGASEILVVNRSLDRAEEVARAVGGHAVAFERLVEAVSAADIVISSTSSSEHVISVPVVRSAMDARDSRSLLCVDIAVPRDIDPDVARIPNVLLYNIDDLEAACSANLLSRQAEVAAVEAIVDDGVADYREWQSVQVMIPTIGALYRRAESIRRTEIDRTIPRLRSLSADDRELIDVMTASIVRRLLHEPVAALKARSGLSEAGDLAQVVRQLFSLDEQTSAATGA